MAGMSLGQAMQERLALAQNRQRMTQQKINDDYQIGMINAQSRGGGSQPKAPAATVATAKPPTFSNIGNLSSLSGGVGNSARPAGQFETPASIVANSQNRPMAASLPINEGQPGSGTIGRTLYTTDAAGGTSVPTREGYQTEADPMIGGSTEAFKNSMREQRGYAKGTACVSHNPLSKHAGYMHGKTRVTDQNGSPTVDTVDAKLADGEAVLNAGAAELLGRKKIAELNKQGLAAMGMKNAQPYVEDGKMHAYAGIDFNDPEMVRSAQNAEMRRRMAAPQNQPIARAPVAPPVSQTVAPTQAAQRPPVYDVKYIPPENAEKAGLGKAKPSALTRISAAQQATYNAPKPGMARKIGSGIVKGGIPLAAVAAMSDASDEDSTKRYAQRFNVAEPTGDGSVGDIAKFAALRAGGFASDLGNRATFGLAGKFYRDNQQPQIEARTKPAQPQQDQQAAMQSLAQQPVAPQQSAQPAAQPANPEEAAYSQFFTANGITDQMRSKPGKGLTDMSDAGNKIYKQVDAQGRTTYTGMGSPTRVAQEKAKAEQPKTEEAVKIAAAQATLDENAFLREIRDKAINGDAEAIKAWNMINPPKQADEYAHATEKTTDPQTGAVTEKPVFYNKRTGPLAQTAQQSAPQAKRFDANVVLENAKNMVTQGRMTLEQANAELKANGYPTI